MEELIPTPERYTVADYFRIDVDPRIKYEYVDGDIVAMAGGTSSHSIITGNVITALNNRLRERPCQVYDSNIRVRAKYDTRYSYPDAMVVCDEGVNDPLDPRATTIINPTLVVEVLSQATEGSDRGEKFLAYLRTGTLREYVLVAQDQHRVESFLRQSDGTWSFSYFDGIEAVAKLRSLQIELPLAEVYLKVQLPPP